MITNHFLNVMILQVGGGVFFGKGVCLPGNSAGDLSGMVSSRDPNSKVVGDLQCLGIKRSHEITWYSKFKDTMLTIKVGIHFPTQFGWYEIQKNC